MKIIIAVPDFTRKAHLRKILPVLLKKLNKDGMAFKDIEILIGTGLHRKPAAKEIKDNIGPISKKVKISSHDYSKKNVIYFGKTKNKVPVYLNKKLKNADSVITVGVVEPHLYAGYSGGVKVVAIGLAGEKTINFTHHPRFLDHPSTKICNLRGNQFRLFINEISAILPIDYSVNIVNDKKGSLLRVFEGHPEISFREAVKYSKNIFEKKLKAKYNAIICDIPEEKSLNLYQASRAFNYVSGTRKTALAKDSLILVKASLKENFGRGLGEKRFMKKIHEVKCPEKTIREIKKSGCLAGEHRAYMVAKAMTRSGLGFITRNKKLLKNKKLPFLFFGSEKEAINYIKKKFIGPKVYYLRNAFKTILIKT